MQSSVILERNGKAMRFYQKAERIVFILCDFCPIRDKVMSGLEELGVMIEEIEDYPDADMGVIIARGQVMAMVDMIGNSEVL